MKWIEKGYYHSEKVAHTLLKSLKKKKEITTVKLEEHELKFLQLSCSELTYAENSSAHVFESQNNR